jgi:hypothetical protein
MIGPRERERRSRGDRRAEANRGCQDTYAEHCRLDSNQTKLSSSYIIFLRRSKYDKCLGSTAAPSYSYSLPFNIILHCLSISYRSNVVKSGIVKNVKIAAAKDV